MEKKGGSTGPASYQSYRGRESQNGAPISRLSACRRNVPAEVGPDEDEGHGSKMLAADVLTEVDLLGRRHRLITVGSTAANQVA